MADYDFGKTLKGLLTERDMTQKQLAQAVEIDPVTLNRYVKGERNIPLPTLKKIASYLNVQPQELFGTKDEDFLIWHYKLLEGAAIDIEKGIEQAIEQGRDKSFIFPILRKYYSKAEIQDLLDSYGDEEVERKDQIEYIYNNLKTLSFAPPASLFEGETAEDKMKLITMYFNSASHLLDFKKWRGQSSSEP